MERDLETLARKHRAERAYYIAEAIATGIAALVKWFSTRPAPVRARKALAST